MNDLEKSTGPDLAKHTVSVTYHQAVPRVCLDVSVCVEETGIRRAELDSASATLQSLVCMVL